MVMGRAYRPSRACGFWEMLPGANAWLTPLATDSRRSAAEEARRPMMAASLVHLACAFRPRFVRRPAATGQQKTGDPAVREASGWVDWILPSLPQDSFAARNLNTFVTAVASNPHKRDSGPT